MSTSLGLSAWRLSFQFSPIILVNGIAEAIPGGMLPVISITESVNFFDGLLGGAPDLTEDNFFANFQPVSGARIIDNQFGNYPFANQAVAANAIIAQPLAISMRMICPVRNDSGYAQKLATITTLQNTLAQHNNLGGTYIVATPSFYYDSCILLALTDVSGQHSKQPQTEWQWDFAAPLLTLAQAQEAQNALMSRMSSGGAVAGDPPSATGLSPAVGYPPGIAASSVAPAASNVGGASISPPWLPQ